MKHRKRDIQIAYRIWESTQTVSSVLEEVQHRVWGWVKNLAIGGDLKEMSWEPAIFGPAVNPQVMLFGDDVLAGCNSARSACDDLLDSTDWSDKESIEDLQKHLLANRSVWMIDDPYFSLEISSLANLKGASGVKHIKAAVLACLPGEESHKPVAECKAAVKDLESAPWFKFLHSDGKAVVSEVLGVLEAFVARRPPNRVDCLEASDFLRSAKSKMWGFVTFALRDRNLVGKEALDMHLEYCQDTVARGDFLTFDQVSQLSTFGVVLCPEKRGEIGKLNDMILSNMQLIASQSTSLGGRVSAEGLGAGAPGVPAASPGSSSRMEEVPSEEEECAEEEDEEEEKEHEEEAGKGKGKGDFEDDQDDFADAGAAEAVAAEAPKAAPPAKAPAKRTRTQAEETPRKPAGRGGQGRARGRGAAPASAEKAPPPAKRGRGAAKTAAANSVVSDAGGSSAAASSGSGGAAGSAAGLAAESALVKAAGSLDSFFGPGRKVA